MKKLQNNLWFALAAVCAVALVIFSLENFATQPWRIIPELGGDAAKNIFTYLYHSTHGKGFWFDGMNYPYGEHIVYTDGQPVLSGLLTLFHGVTVGQALSVLWWLIGLSYVVGILYIYKILVHFKMSPFIAVVFACIIGIFTPQILRLQSHYALSYTCIIPMLFYWTIRYNESRQWRYCVYFFITGCIAAFMHPYYAAMMLIWVSSYVAGYFVFTQARFIQKARFILPLFSSVILVLAFMTIVMKLTDPVTDRPATPFNTLYETCTRPKQIITSIHTPIFKPLVGTTKSHFISDGGEGYVYLGLVAVFTLGICFVLIVRRSLRQKKVDILIGATGFSPIWLFMALAVLVFSMGIPFVWHLEWLMNYLAIFKQFRSLGRFSWIFYYIITIYAALVLYRYYSEMVARRKFFMGYVVLLLSIGLWSFEASGYVRYARYLSKKGLYGYDMIFSAGEQNWQSFLQEHHFKRDDFQAILMLPFFHIGTEKLWVGYPDWQVTLSSKAALQLYLPVVDVMMSRSSWSQAKKQVRIAGGPYTDKPLLRDIKSRKPFLLMHFDNDSLYPDQKYLLQAADYIGHYSQCYIYACYPDRITANDRKNADSITRILPFLKSADTVISGCGVVFFDHFDGNTNEQHLFGTGGSTLISQDSVLIKTIQIPPPKDSMFYEFSCWFLLGDKDYRSPYITLQLINTEGKVDTATDALTTKSLDNNGMWFRASRFFWIHNNIRSIRCMLVNVPKPTYLGMDEMMLRPNDAMIISRSADGKVMVNNYLFNRGK
jgi:hypothetical protein